MKKSQLERMLKTEKEMRIHFEDLFQTAVDELKFKNMLVDMLEKELEFLQTATNDNLVKQTIDIILARKMSDVLFHNRKIWENCDGLKTNKS